MTYGDPIKASESLIEAFMHARGFWVPAEGFFDSFQGLWAPVWSFQDATIRGEETEAVDTLYGCIGQWVILGRCL